MLPYIITAVVSIIITALVVWFASSFALFSISLIIFAVSSFTSSSMVFKRYSLACSEVNPEILSSS